MAKNGMARPDWTHPQPKNELPPVPEIQGKTKASAKPVIPGTNGPDLKVSHKLKGDGSISEIYPVIDNDLARDNLENDLPEADREDL